MATNTRIGKIEIGGISGGVGVMTGGVMFQGFSTSAPAPVETLFIGKIQDIAIIEKGDGKFVGSQIRRVNISNGVTKAVSSKFEAIETLQADLSKKCIVTGDITVGKGGATIKDSTLDGKEVIIMGPLTLENTTVKGTLTCLSGAVLTNCVVERIICVKQKADAAGGAGAAASPMQLFLNNSTATKILFEDDGVVVYSGPKEKLPGEETIINGTLK